MGSTRACWQATASLQPMIQSDTLEGWQYSIGMTPPISKLSRCISTGLTCCVSRWIQEDDSCLLLAVTFLVVNVGDMLATCCHKIHVLVILGRYANYSDTDHHISRVVSQFGVVVCTKSVVVLTNHNRPAISCPHPLLVW